MVAVLLTMRSRTDQEGHTMLETIVGDMLGYHLDLREQSTRRLQPVELVRSRTLERDGLTTLTKAACVMEGPSPTSRHTEPLITPPGSPADSSGSESEMTPRAPAEFSDASDSKLDFFISYTDADQAWASWIAWELEEAGFQVYVGAWDFVPGMNWQAAMQKGVSECERTIALVSRAYLHSVYGQLEWQVTQASDPRGMSRQLIPIRIEECALPELMSGVVSFDLFGLSQESARARLLEQVGHTRTGRRKPTQRPPFPLETDSTFLRP
jgi:TIR domain/Effector-associated domain 2